MHNGPTLNKFYNEIYEIWEAIGYNELPKCDECHCDVTGKDFFESGTSWFCKDCFDKIGEDIVY